MTTPKQKKAEPKHRMPAFPGNRIYDAHDTDHFRGKNQTKPILLIAMGGNALIRKGQKGSIDEQFTNLKVPIRQIARLSRRYRIIITHGNGPQVGNLLLQQECCDEVPDLPLEILVAQTEGQIGYMIESTLDGELMALGINYRPLVSLLTYVVVDKNDPAFDSPAKPIGPGYTKKIAAGLDYPTVKTAKGYRRVVASPKPVTIVEYREIKQLVDMDFIVICCGGGGIPVIREDRAFCGVNAVIDKDLASVCLAEKIGVDIFLVATDVDGVMLDYNTENQRLVRTLARNQADTYRKAGQFPAGSIWPKIEAGLQFIENSQGAGQKRAVIASIKSIEAAVNGQAGTEFV